MTRTQPNATKTLAEEIRAQPSSGAPISTTLATNARVIARVTDGIYREPGSAIRELISNAYDADATAVYVDTDTPRFAKITVRDNGNGMTPEILAHMLKNIGGSAKRTDEGKALGVADEADAERSPGGRKLIGKLGIGLFSVSQLTRAFQIVTKTVGDTHQTVAAVRLHQFNETVESSEDAYEAGTVKIWREPASNPRQHGTSVILTDVRPPTREALRSKELWDSIDASRAQAEAMGVERPESYIPAFHIGRLDLNDEFLTENVGPTGQSLPWEDSDSPEKAFSKMVDAAWDSASAGDPNPSLERLFDNYLKMIWELALALPLPYVRGDIFEEQASDWARFFKLSNTLRGSVAEELEADESVTVAELCGLTEETRRESAGTSFVVTVDRLELRRPIRYRDLPTTSHSINYPLVFTGSYRNDFAKVPSGTSGGPLEFYAYFFWNAKISPVDHRGALIRIHGSSGAPFDNTFFRYQISEQTRLRQITCEIFVRQGLEPALNIDREAYNTSHPHMTVVTRWVHSALRQIATAQKRVGSEIRSNLNAQTTIESRAEIDAAISEVNDLFAGGEESIPRIVFGSKSVDASRRHEIETPWENSTDVVQAFSIPSPPRVTKDERESAEKLAAIAQVLSVAGVFIGMTELQRDTLMAAIQRILKK